jgi:hypothetical protein
MHSVRLRTDCANPQPDDLVDQEQGIGIIEAVGKPSDCCMQLRSPAFHKAGLLLFSAQCELWPGIRRIPLEVRLDRGRAQNMLRAQPGISPAWMRGDDN